MTCMICLESLTKEIHTLVDCGHEFHSNCIIQWFRSGKKTCPLCLNEGSNYINVLANYTDDERCRLIKETASSDNAPIHLKNELNKYAESSEKIKKLECDLDTFKSAYKGTYNTLKNKVLMKTKQIKHLIVKRDRRWKRILKYGICTIVIPLKKTIFSD